MSTNSVTLSGSASDSYSIAALTGRVLLSGMFIVAGFAKLTAVSGTAAWFGSLGLPFPALTTVVVGLVELVGGLAVLAGFYTRLAAVVLALFTLAATAVAHLNLADQMQLLLFQKNIAIAGGFLLLSAFGPGRLSIDGWRKLS